MPTKRATFTAANNQVADFFFEMREIGRSGLGVGIDFKFLFCRSFGQMIQRVDDFGFFFVDFFEDAAQVVPVEADAGGAAGELVGFERGGQDLRDVTENRCWTSIRRGRFPLAAAGVPEAFSARSCALICSQFFRTSLEFLAFTSPKTCGWRRTILVCTDSITSEMVNAPVSSARIEWKITCSSKSPSSEEKCFGVARFHGVEDFVGFFDQEFTQGLMRLLAVPGATARPAQARLQRDQFFEPFASAFVAGGDGNFRSARGPS